MQTNRITNLTPHKMLTGRPMPFPYLRGPYEGPPLEQLQMELRAYMEDRGETDPGPSADAAIAQGSGQPTGSLEPRPSTSAQSRYQPDEFHW